MKLVEHVEWDQSKITPQAYPQCTLCDVLNEPAIIYRGNDFIIRGWKCPRCALTFIHSKDVSKALVVLTDQQHS